MIYDLVVIGGGINGAAVLREAVARGLKAALLERADFGSGSTSRSSRLLHCGLRYLAPGGSMMEFVRRPGQFAKALRTVRRSVTARNTLVRERPHLLRPIRMMFPLFEGDTYAGWQIDAAFALLGQFGRGGAPLDYRRYRPGKLGEELPFLDALSSERKLAGVVAYTEYQIDWPERLAMDLILEAQAMGALARNYDSVVRLERGAQMWRVTTESGGEFRARAIANLAGPWVDAVAGLSSSEVPRMVNTTRGAHIRLSLPERFRGHGIMTMSGLDHPFYCFPWRDSHFFGPTEEPTGENPDRAAPSAIDEADLLSEAQRQLPGLDLGSVEVRGGWAGLRPLTHEPLTMMAARNRVIHELETTGGPKMLSLTNGSLGAHAVTAREMLDMLGHQHRTAGSAIGTAEPSDEDPVVAACTQNVVHLEDLMWRRLGLAWDDDAGLGSLDAVGDVAARTLGWSVDRTTREKRNYTCIVKSLGLIKIKCY